MWSRQWGSLYSFDKANRLTNVSDWASRNTAYIYDAASLLSGQTNANGTTVGYTYDNAERLITMNNKKSDQSVISSYSFTLDPVGNRTNVNQIEPLIAGNPAVNTAYTYNAANQIQTAGPTTFTSDFNGNLKTQATNGVTRTFTFDFEDRLTNATDGTTTAQYIYNGDGQRLAKTFGGVTTRFVLDPTSRLTRVLAEIDGSGSITNYYTHGLGLIAKITPSAQYYHYHFDVRGSTVAISNASQVIVNRYSYDPFGVVTGLSEQTPNSFQYLGQAGIMKETFDLLFVARRFYGSNIGRFLSRDRANSIATNPQTLNEYIYSLNNPILLIDPTGLSGERDGRGRFEPNGPSTNAKVGFLGRILGVKVANASEAEFRNTYISAPGAPDPNELCYVRDEDRIQQRLRQLLRQNGLDTNPLNIDLGDTQELVHRNGLYEQARREVLGNRYNGPDVPTYQIFFQNLFDFIGGFFP